MEIDIIRYNLKDMLDLRGDDVSYITEHGDAVETQRYYNELIVLNTDKTTVFFALNKDIVKDLKVKLSASSKSLIDEHSTKNFIVVMNDVYSPVMQTFLTTKDKELQEDGGMLQIFYVKELLYNPTKHSLVPVHTKLTEAETKEILQEYLAKKSQMPIIHRTDPIARWLGLKHGDTVKITRYNDTSGEYFYYRTCV